MAAQARVLATDDRPEVLRLIARTLGRRYVCELAGDVESARRKLEEGEFELALCDIEMPGESGLVLAEEIVEAYPLTAVVLVTGVDDPEVAQRAFEFGAHGYLVKPFWPGQLMITAMNALRRRELEIAEKAHSQALQERLQTVMDRAPMPIYVHDRERRYLLANRATHEFWGAEPGQLIGRLTADVLPPAAEDAFAEADRVVLDEGGTYETEHTLLLGDEERTFFTVKFPYVDDAGEIVGVYGISQDMTDKQRAEDLREELTRAQERAIEDLRVSRLETVDRLTKAIERHDADTGVHISRMAAVAALLGQRYGFDTERVQLLRAAAPMHDVGKVATPDAILRKPGALTAAEHMEMQRHTIVGHEILTGSDSDLLELGATIALTHHERWDGGGYPQGLSGEEIPIEGRIVAVADVLDALLSDRSYRPALTLEQALEVIREGRGSHFDPEIVDLLLENLEEALSLRG